MKKKIDWWSTRATSPSLRLDVEFQPLHWKLVPRFYWDHTRGSGPPHPGGLLTYVQWLFLKIEFSTNYPPFEIVRIEP